MRPFLSRSLCTCAVVFTFAIAQPASAVDVLSGRLAIRDACVLSDLQSARSEQPRVQESFFAPILAGIAGSLAQSAVGGLASAIQAASEEHTYSVPAAAGFMAGDVARKGEGAAPWRFDGRDYCLIYYVPAPDSKIGLGRASFVKDAVSKKLLLEADSASKVGTLQSIGMADREPIVYAEIALLSLTQSVVIRPLLVWYRQPIPGTKKQPQQSELSVALGIPGYSKDGDELGTLFALQRIRLPPLTPGSDPLKVADLANLFTLFQPTRPTTGLVDERVASHNAVVAAVETARVAELAASRSLAAAKAKADQTKKPEDIAAAKAAEDALGDATGRVTQAVKKQADLKPEPVGVTNARVTFLTIRDANKFGLAIAKALGAQQEAAGKAVTGALTPQPAWQTSDTAFLTAMLDVQSKQAAYDSAAAKGDPAEILVARNALLIAKAKANESAIANNRSPPYPNVLQDGGI